MTADGGPGAPGRTSRAGRPVSRRGLLTGGAVALTGAGVGAAAGAVMAGASPAATEPDPVAVGARTVPFHGRHQAGIATPAQAYATFVAFDLAAGVDRAALGRWMRVWTDDAARLTQGRPALADTEPELAITPAGLTVTVGVGERFVAAAGRSAQPPAWLRPLPGFGIDALQERWNGGDVVVQICADDPVAVSHAVRMLGKDARAFATVRWMQRGFLHAAGAIRPGSTHRNLMGQLDGTTNPAPDTPEFDTMVWIDDGPDWLVGGTSLVFRRIRIELDTWDVVDRRGKEEAVGRRLSDGGPLTGEHEHDEPDFDAVGDGGLTVIPPWSHIRRARPDDPRQRILRRPYNYDDGPGETSVSEVGLLLASYQADVDAQFVPIQQRLAEQDLLNEWTTPIGSAVFAVLPGVADGEWLGQALLA